MRSGHDDVERAVDRSGFSLIELITVIAIVGLLASLMLPAVQSARESARSAACRSNLHQISVAVHNFHGVNNAIPPMDLADQWATWGVFLMPYLEAMPQYSRWDLQKQYYVQPEDAGTDLAVLHCPTQLTFPRAGGDVRFIWGEGIFIGPPGWTDYACVRGTDVAVDNGPFRRSVDRATGMKAAPDASSSESLYTNWKFPISFADLAPDGLSNTLLFGEKHFSPAVIDRSVWNGDDQPAYARACGLSFPLATDSRQTAIHQFGSRHPNTCYFALGDGQVRGISADLDLSVLHSLAHVGDEASHAP